MRKSHVKGVVCASVLTNTGTDWCDVTGQGEFISSLRSNGASVILLTKILALPSACVLGIHRKKPSIKN